MPGKTNKFSRLNIVNGKPAGRRYAKIVDAPDYREKAQATA
jgi:hypothetical protein